MFRSNRTQVLREVEAAEERALEKVGLFVEGRAKLLTPVDTGRLRDSIDHKVKDKSVIVGTNVEYASHVEYGTSKQEAQPFLVPAVENNKSEIKRLIVEELRNVGD